LLILFLALILALYLLLASGVRAAARGRTTIGLSSVTIALLLLLFAAWLTAFTVGGLVLLGAVLTTLGGILVWGPPSGDRREPAISS
jgi:hypothetical protein